jgi:hypothetical protein
MVIVSPLALGLLYHVWLQETASPLEDLPIPTHLATKSEITLSLTVLELVAFEALLKVPETHEEQTGLNRAQFALSETRLQDP